MKIESLSTYAVNTNQGFKTASFRADNDVAASGDKVSFSKEGLKLATQQKAMDELTDPSNTNESKKVFFSYI